MQFKRRPPSAQLGHLARRGELGRRQARREEVTMSILAIIGAIVVIIVVLKVLGLF